MPCAHSTPIIAALAMLVGAALPVKAADTWSDIVDGRSGAKISYPVGVFIEKSAEPDGRILISPDGRARLLVGSFLNETRSSLSDYRAQILEDNYAGSALDYAPVRRTWFVVSGTMGDTMFYERVSFSCSGRYINSWAMIYPVAERATYDRLVESIAPTFKPISASHC